MNNFDLSPKVSKCRSAPLIITTYNLDFKLFCQCVVWDVKLSIKCQQKIIMIESCDLQYINKLSQYSNKYLNYKS